MSADVIQGFGQRVGYNEEEMKKFTEGQHRTRYVGALSKTTQNYTIQVEVVDSKHCNTGYKAGDKFIMDVYGNLISKLNPKRLCVYLVSQMVIPVALINERISEGLEPDDFHFMRYIRCPDAGVHCLGYGEVLAKVSAVPRNEI